MVVARKSPAKKKFMLRSKPLKPEPKDVMEKYEIELDDTLDGIVSWASSFDIPFDKVEIDDSGGYDYSEYFFRLRRPETPQESANRQEKYKKDLYKYDKWKKENRVAIKKELRDREQKLIEKNRKSTERAYKAREKRIRELEKELGKLRDI